MYFYIKVVDESMNLLIFFVFVGRIFYNYIVNVVYYVIDVVYYVINVLYYVITQCRFVATL